VAPSCEDVMHKWNFPPEYYARSLKTLQTALSEATAYKSWKTIDPGPWYPIDQRYTSLPVLTKRDIREHFPDGFVPVGRDLKQALDSGELRYVSTSGSTDVAVTNIWNQDWWDASERASWKLNTHAMKACTGTQNEVILSNPVNVGIVSDGVDLTLEQRRLSRFLYLNEKSDIPHWSAAHMDRMLAELDIFKPAVFEANPSLLARLCRYAYGTGKKVFQPEIVVFTYEYPASFHLRQIKRVFTSHLISSYGSTEAGYVFMQCEEGKLHQNMDYCRVDFQPLKPEHGGPSIGRLLVTTFNNPWYIMVRFDVSDLARLDDTGTCKCGRNDGIILSSIEGRVGSSSLACDGRLVTVREIDNALGQIEAIDEYRVEQIALCKYELHMVAAASVRESTAKNATEIMKQVYGRNADISVIQEKVLAPEESGKYAIVKSYVPIQIQDYLAGTG
jgi:phenylacetate-coenzyme A ligase PaaK-like adenylate-forming protein